MTVHLISSISPEALPPFIFCPAVTAFVQLLSPVDFHVSSLAFLHLLIHTFLKMNFLKHIPSLPSSDSTAFWMMIRLQIQRLSSWQILMSTFTKGFIHSSPNVPCFFLSPSFYICSFLYLCSRTFLILHPLTQHIFQDTFKYHLKSNSWFLLLQLHVPSLFSHNTYSCLLACITQ